MHTTLNPDDRFKPVALSKTFRRIRRTLGLNTKKTLDLGCGYGEYLVAFGEGSTGITTTLAEVEYGATKGIPIVQGNVEHIDTLNLATDFKAIWANNLFEHLLSPHAFLIKLKTVASADAVLVLGVPVVPRIASFLHLKPFRGALAVAHINFFTRESLRLTVERAGWKVEAVRPFISSIRFIDMLLSFFAPHLYVVAKNDPTFKYAPKKLKEWKDDPLYQPLIHIANGKGTSE